MTVDVKADDGIPRCLILELDALTVTFPQTLNIGRIWLGCSVSHSAKKCAPKKSGADENFSAGSSRGYVEETAFHRDVVACDYGHLLVGKCLGEVGPQRTAVGAHQRVPNDDDLVALNVPAAVCASSAHPGSGDEYGLFPALPAWLCLEGDLSFGGGNPSLLRGLCPSGGDDKGDDQCNGCGFHGIHFSVMVLLIRVCSRERLHISSQSELS